MIAVLGAMHEELHALIGSLQAPRTTRIAGRDFHAGTLHGQAVLLALSGIGKVAASITATLALQHFGARSVLFTGVAGGLGEGVAIGDLVVADALLQHDLDASPIVPRYEVPGTGLARFATDPGTSDALEAAVRECIGVRAFGDRTPAVHRGLVVSGDRFVSTAAESTALRARLPDALAVEMEGAAVAQVCHAFGVPLAVLRTVSDRADDDATVDFVRFVAEVASVYSREVVHAWLRRA